MTWLPVQIITTSKAWTLTEPIVGNLFKIKNSTNSQNSSQFRLRIAQAFDDIASFTVFDIRKILYKTESELFLFIQPTGLENRRIAIKRDDDLSDEWRIDLEVFDSEVIYNPRFSTIGVNSMESQQPTLESKFITLINKITATDRGNWIQVPPFYKASFVIEGMPERADSDINYDLISTAQVHIWTSSNQPRNNFDGVIVTRRFTNSIFTCSDVFNWVRASVPQYDIGEINVYLYLVVGSIFPN